MKTLNDDEHFMFDCDVLELHCHSPPVWFFLPLFTDMTTAAGVSLIYLCHRLAGKFCILFEKGPLI